MAFPTTRPEGACFVRPQPDETLEFSPPGFSWWQAGERGKVNYRLKVATASGAIAYESPVIADPAHVPDRALPAGAYTWTVEALDEGGKTLATRAPQAFTIAPNATAMPWVPAAELLGRVPREHPRLLFPKSELPAVRATLDTTRKDAFASLKRNADRALKLTPPPEPQYDKLPTQAERKMGYKHAFAEMRKYHTDGMVNLSLMYALTGEKKYGEVAKAILLGAAEWDPEGISSIMSPFGDEIGLGLVKSAAQTYDWVYDLLTDAERAKVKAMLLARGDQLLRRLQKRDFLARPEESHAGRLPGYLLEHAIALAEEPRAEIWMDYAMRVYLTVFPHWAGKDGGWAEGISYGLAYNTIYLMPFESLRHATGFDLWQRPFYQKVRYFFLYCISPKGDIAPFGDTEHAPMYDKLGGVRSLLLFHAARYNDPAVRWWADQLKTSKGEAVSVAPLPGLFVADDDVKGARPDELPNDAQFRGVGWAALHSDLLDPANDLMVSFKSSPYGAVSHSHADQNSFAIMKGGKSLAIPAGARYPIHGSPFHVEYVQQTMAHNAILVDGAGQLNRKSGVGGRLAGFESKTHLAYVCGDARDCYGGKLDRCRRHVLMIRPSVVVVVDDLAAPKPAEFQWLLHAHNQFELNEARQSLVSRKDDVAMAVNLFTAGGFAFAQTDEYPVDPKKGYPKVTDKPPAKQWHFTAATRAKSAARRIAAIMLIEDAGKAPDCEIRPQGPDGGVIEIKARTGGDEATVRIVLSPESAGAAPIIEANYRPVSGEVESIRAD